MPQSNENDIFIPGPEGPLEAKIFYPEAPAKEITAIVCHPHSLFGGTMHNKVVTTVARALSSLGISAVCFNFRGVGKSEGSFGEGIGETEDLLAVARWIKSNSPAHVLWVAGFSMGAYVAYRGAPLTSANQLILIAPPVNHFDFTHLPLPDCPCLVVQGDKDELVPAHEVFAWIEQLSTPPKLIRMPEADHFFHGQLVLLRDQLVQSLSRS